MKENRTEMNGVECYKNSDLHGLGVPRRPIKNHRRVSRWDSGVSTPDLCRVPRSLSPGDLRADAHQTSVLSKYKILHRQTAFGRKEFLFGSTKASEDSLLHPKTKTKTSEDNPPTKTAADYFHSIKWTGTRHVGLSKTKKNIPIVRHNTLLPFLSIKCKRSSEALKINNNKCLLYLASILNGTLNKPPMFTPEDYDTWKVRMEGFIGNQDFKLWKSVLEGPFIPTVPAAGAGGAPVPKDPALYSDEDYKRMEVDSKALWLIQMAIPNSIIHAFKKCKSAQELWNSLQQMYEGSEDVKENKKDMLKQKFENFCQQNNEKMTSQYLSDVGMFPVYTNVKPG
ncbi:hypothetical protein E3N88_05235 [Mikania micrantha]|uniref:DUF4219 domain-containing protein n=1 Tax=Mikania micrantha TaxID=192012 RepID=A0A5N6PY66_9ASTR|nr:hypothetical protein E3N88_05235 [Mikania micrantha]